MNINGELREASMEIDSDNNLERFKPDKAEAVEIHDFQSVREFVLVLCFFSPLPPLPDVTQQRLLCA